MRLRIVFGFIGITNPEVIIAEGIALGPDQREISVKKALGDIALLKAA